MIVLDTNQIRLLNVPHGAVYLLLEQIAAVQEHPLALPQMVLDEHLAHYRHDVEVALRAVQSGSDALDRLVARPYPKMILPDPAASMDALEALMRSQFHILETPECAEREGFAREAHRRRPADIAWEEKKRGGGRDVVVWLTVLDALARFPDAEVVFITADGDFTGKEGVLHPALHEEVTGRGLDPARLRVHRSVVDLLDALAEKVDPPADLGAILDGVATYRSLPASLAREAAAELQRDLRTGFVYALDPDGPADLQLRSTGRSRAYRVGETTWVSVETTWGGTFGVVAVSGEGPGVALPVSPVGFTVSASVLARAATGAEAAAIGMISHGRIRFDQVSFTSL